jgi:phospholipid/cholesterol/gamma-HCH transport system permease protein
MSLVAHTASADLASRRLVQYAQEVAALAWRAAAGLAHRPFYGREYVDQMNDLGVSSLPVVAMTGLVTGMVLALQSSLSLGQFGATSLMGYAVTVPLVRELGPIMASLMVAGRVGAGITSQLGAMRVTSQLDAMVALGTDPIKKLVVPRVVTLTLVLPLLVAIGCFVGICGGWAVARATIAFPSPLFWASVGRSLHSLDLISALAKSAVFGLLISLLASHEGLHAAGGTTARVVARPTPVVVTSLSVLFADFVLTKLFYGLLTE